jgi:hypothetical protein
MSISLTKRLCTSASVFSLFRESVNKMVVTHQFGECYSTTIYGAETREGSATGS